MKRLLVVCFLLSIAIFTHAQNIKSQVVVLGNSGAATAAAYQAALSGVKTTLVLGADDFDVFGQLTNFDSGFEGRLKKKMRELEQVPDSVKINITPSSVNKALFSWADSIQNLNVIKSTSWIKTEKAGSGWIVRLQDGKNIRSGVLVLGVKENEGDFYKYTPHVSGQKLDYTSSLYRTSLAGYSIQNTPFILTMDKVLVPEIENLVLVNSDDSNMVIGQAAGVVAAYGQFFSVKTSQTKLKGAQGEMLAFNQELIPVSDISGTDKNWRAIQNILQSGVLKLEMGTEGSKFNPDSLVTIEEIDQATRAYFYKAQLWMEDHEEAVFTLEKALDLIAYTRNKSLQNTINEVEKKWKNSYHFTQEFDKSKPITRREFAAIALDYFQLDQVNVDKNGVVIR